MSDDADIQSILHYWFGPLDQNGNSAPAKQALWFKSSKDTDQEIEQQFGALVKKAIGGGLQHWLEHENGLIAHIVLLDQFTRNIYRGSALAFAGDELALKLARAATVANQDRALPIIYRVFLCIPFEHAEDLQTQTQGVEHFGRLIDENPASSRELIEGYRRYAVAHREVIIKFGRFPHRNAILERSSSIEELEHLKTHGGF